MGQPEVHRTVEAVWRIESARLVAGLYRLVRDVGWAEELAQEELAQEAMVAALEQRPRDGIPKIPGAWLMAVSKRRAIDGHRQMAQRKLTDLGHELTENHAGPDLDATLPDRRLAAGSAPAR